MNSCPAQKPEQLLAASNASPSWKSSLGLVEVQGRLGRNPSPANAPVLQNVIGCTSVKNLHCRFFISAPGQLPAPFWGQPVQAWVGTVWLGNYLKISPTLWGTSVWWGGGLACPWFGERGQVFRSWANFSDTLFSNLFCLLLFSSLIPVFLMFEMPQRSLQSWLTYLIKTISSILIRAAATIKSHMGIKIKQKAHKGS